MVVYYSQAKGSEKEMPEYILAEDGETKVDFSIQPLKEEDESEDYIPGVSVKDVLGIYVQELCIAYFLIFEDASTQIEVVDRSIATTMMIPRTLSEPQSIHNLLGRKTHINR